MSDFQAGDGASGAASMTAQAQEKVQETAHQATRKGTQMLREQTETRAAQASDELRAVAEAMRRSGHSLHADGKPSAAAVDAVTDRIERLADYLGATSGDRMLHDVESFGRRRPWGLIGIGLGVGLVASRFLKASSESRYTAASTAPRPAQPATAPPPPALPPVTREPAAPAGYPYRAG